MDDNGIGVEEKTEINHIDIEAECAYKRLTQQNKEVCNDESDFEIEDHPYNLKNDIKSPLVKQDSFENNSSDVVQINNPVQLNPYKDPSIEVLTNKIINTGDKNEDNNQDDKDENVNDNDDNDKDDEDEWDKLVLVNQGLSPASTTDLITVEKVLKYIKEGIIAENCNKNIRPVITYSGVNAILHWFIGPPKLDQQLVKDRDWIFTFAAIAFNHSDEFHLRILQTIYYGLTKSTINCPRFGSHWENIGFQGNDPSTDLRGCGMLGLISVLDFILCPSTSRLAAKIYLLSQDAIQNFPFCIMSINVTRISLQILREGKLNKLCNCKLKEKRNFYVEKDESIVYDTFRELYTAIFYQIYSVWKNEGKTMADSGYVLKEVEDNAKRKPLDIIKSFKDLSKHETFQMCKADKIESFLGIEDL